MLMISSVLRAVQLLSVVEVARSCKMLKINIIFIYINSTQNITYIGTIKRTVINIDNHVAAYIAG